MNISDKELEQAKNLINSFCIGEFGNATDFTKKRRKAPAFRYGDIRRIQISE